MRLFELLNIQHYVLYLIPAIVTIVLLAVALGYSHFRSEDSEERKTRIVGRYPAGIEERNAPFPLFLILVILGTILWGLAYIIGYGVYQVRI